MVKGKEMCRVEGSCTLLAFMSYSRSDNGSNRRAANRRCGASWAVRALVAISCSKRAGRVTSVCEIVLTPISYPLRRVEVKS